LGNTCWLITNIFSSKKSSTQAIYRSDENESASSDELTGVAKYLNAHSAVTRGPSSVDKYLAAAFFCSTTFLATYLATLDLGVGWFASKYLATPDSLGALLCKYLATPVKPPSFSLLDLALRLLKKPPDLAEPLAVPLDFLEYKKPAIPKTTILYIRYFFQ
jgi:hypothetical protein